MLQALCSARPKPWILSALSFTAAAAHGAPSYHHDLHHHLRITGAGGKLAPFINAVAGDQSRRRHHTSACCQIIGGGGGAASIWHGILPSGGNCRRECRLPATTLLHEQRGEGSWNVAWDVRPARWLHGSDSAWLLFGVCACFAPLDCGGGGENLNAVSDLKEGLGGGSEETKSDAEYVRDRDYRVTGVLADGRCLFRAVAHGACLRNGEEAPNEARQRELADELRAQVVAELLNRRKEAQWFIEGDFDEYVKNMREPCAWGGEPELLMASHVLKAPISVFTMDGSSGNLMHISSYGQEYEEAVRSPIKVLFHGYGHYDIIETLTDLSYPKIET